MNPQKTPSPRWAGALIAAALAGTLGSPILRAQTTAQRANDFLDSIGINTKISQGIDSVSGVSTSLTYAGIRNIRDDGANMNGLLSVHTSTGAKVCLLPPNGNVSGTVSRLVQLKNAGALLAADGPNEPNNWPVTYNGQTSNDSNFMPIAQFCRDMYAAVKANPALAGVPVFSSSDAAGDQPNNCGLQFLKTPTPTSTLIGQGTMLADYANCHNYVVGNGTPVIEDNIAWKSMDPTLNGRWNGLYANFGNTWRNHYIGYTTAELTTLPRVCTETGWQSTHPHYLYNPAGAGWTFTGNAGITQKGSAFGMSTPPNGVQMAFVKGDDGQNGTVSQVVNFASTGTYTLHFHAAKRTNSGGQQTFRVTVDGETVGTFTPASGTFAACTTSAFTISTTGNHTIAFTGTTTTGENTAFVDAVSILKSGGGSVTVNNSSFETPVVLGGIAPAKQGTIFLNLFLAAYKQGWKHTFIYQLRDYAPYAEYYGLFYQDYTPKLSATYLRNLTTILADTNGTFTPGSLPYAIANKPVTVHDLLLQKGNGSFFLAVWNERASGSNSISVALGSTYSTVKVYDPTIGTAPMQTLTNVSSVPLTLSDHPVIIEVPNSSVTLLETYNPPDSSSGDFHTIVSDTGASGGKIAIYDANGAGDQVTYASSANLAPGTYSLKIGIKSGPERPIFQCSVAAAGSGTWTSVGNPIDSYSTAYAYPEFSPGTFTVNSAAIYKFKFTTTGRNASATGTAWKMGMDYIKLIKQ